MCLPCLAGSYSTAAGASSVVRCNPCGAGTFTSGFGQTACQQCVGGTYATSIGGTSESVCLMTCGGGSYSSACGATSITATCTPCAAGSYSLKAGVSACTLCAAGRYFTGIGRRQACDVCSSGSYSAGEGSISCVPCTPGSSAPYSGSTLCGACKEGTYSASQGAAECLACEAGKYATASGQTACTSCAAGTFSTRTGASVTSTCVSCDAGTYVSSTAATRCWQCSAGSVASSASFQTACGGCAVGTYTSGVGTTTCTQCAAGSYMMSTGASVCTLCAPGTSSAVVGATACVACAHGETFTDGAGKTACTDCDPVGGFHCLNTSLQVRCPYVAESGGAPWGVQGGRPYIGPYYAAHGYCGLFACGAGYYLASETANEASVKCIGCASGTHQPSSLATVYGCTACGDNEWAGPNAAECKPCAGDLKTYQGDRSHCECPPGFAADSLGQCTACVLPTGGGLCPVYNRTTALVAQVYCDLVAVRCSCTASGPWTDADATWSQCKEACGPNVDQAAARQSVWLGGRCACNAGYEREDGGECVACAVGHYTVTSACVPCAVHTYAAGTGQSACAACGAGKQTRSVASSSCEPCGGNTYSLRTGGCAPCAANYYTVSSAATECTACPGPTPLRAQAAMQCVAPQDPGPNAEESCDKLRGWWLLQNKCKGCANGFYCKGDGTRTQCPLEKFWSDVYSADVTACRLMTGGEGVSCPEGTQPSQAEHLLQCRAVAGRFGVAGELISVCPQDYYCAAGSIVPTKCPEEQYSNAGSAACVSYVPAPCRDGYYATHESDWRRCEKCPSGAYCHGDRMQACDATGAYFYSEEKSSSAADCKAPFTTQTIQPVAQACPANTYVASTNGLLYYAQFKYMQCRANAGYYFYDFQTTVAHECPLGAYCPRGSAYPLPCGVNTNVTSCGVGFDEPRVVLCPSTRMSAKLEICVACSAVAHGSLTQRDTCEPCCDLGYFAIGQGMVWRCEALNCGQCKVGEYAVLPALCNKNNYRQCKACPGMPAMQMADTISVGYGVHTCPYVCAAGTTLLV